MVEKENVNSCDKVDEEFVVLYLYHYFDYSVFTRTGDEVKETFITGSTPFYCAIPEIKEDTTDIGPIIDIIKKNVRKTTVADVVLVVLYKMILSKSTYDRLKTMLQAMKEEDIILDIYRRSMFKENLVEVVASFPLTFPERVSVNKINS